MPITGFKVKIHAMDFYIGTAGWNLPKEFAEYFGADGSHLERYSQKLNAVEINSSFYKDHKPATYKRWAESVPEDFRFSVKLSKLFTHELHLDVEKDILQENLSGILELGSKLGVILVQLPPSLEYDTEIATEFFSQLRDIYLGPVAFEPRHHTWLSAKALSLMHDFELSKVFADPEPCPLPLEIQPLSKIVYYRLHGSPKIYKSKYGMTKLKELHREMTHFPETQFKIWCVFDNTTYGFATMNALQLQSLSALGKRPPPESLELFF